MAEALWRVSSGPPRAGRHFPGDGRQFAEWFPDEAHAAAYFAAVRWPDGWVCPRCAGRSFVQRPAAWWCPGCRRRFSVKTGTVLEGSSLPVLVWLEAAWAMMQAKLGLSAMTLHRTTGISYEAAWALLHKMRWAMDQAGREKLSGTVEMDETYLGGSRPGRPGRGALGKKVVLVACEVETGDRMGRIRLARAPDASGLAIARFIDEYIEEGSTICTDGYGPYLPAIDWLANETPPRHYNHKATNIKRSPAQAHELMPHVHRVAALFKRWWLGTHQGSMDVQYVDAYLDEFVFRFNRRNSRRRGLLFYRRVAALTATPPVTVEQLRDRAESLERDDQQHELDLRSYDRWVKAQANRRAYRNRKAREAAAASKDTEPAPLPDEYDPKT